MNPINPNLFRQFLKTKEDAIEFQLLLDTISEKLFKTEELPEQILAKETSYEKATAIRRIAQEYGINLQDRNKVAEFFAQLHNVVTSLPLVQLTFAISPKKELITLIHDWFYINFQKTVLLDVELNPVIMAGSIIRFNGKFGDYSLERDISHLVQEDKGK